MEAIGFLILFIFGLNRISKFLGSMSKNEKNKVTMSNLFLKGLLAL